MFREPPNLIVLGCTPNHTVAAPLRRGRNGKMKQRDAQVGRRSGRNHAGQRNPADAKLLRAIVAQNQGRSKHVQETFYHLMFVSCTFDPFVCFIFTLDMVFWYVDTFTPDMSRYDLGRLEKFSPTCALSAVSWVNWFMLNPAPSRVPKHPPGLAATSIFGFDCI